MPKVDLEALFEFSTVIAELTGWNWPTPPFWTKYAAAEAMAMLFDVRIETKEK